MILDAFLMTLCSILFVMTSWSKDGVMSSLIFLTFQVFLSLIYFKFQNDSLGAMVFLLNMGLALTFLYYAFIFHKNTDLSFTMSFKSLLGGSARQNAPAVICDSRTETSRK